jgi:hypothetical protein
MSTSLPVERLLTAVTGDANDGRADQLLDRLDRLIDDFLSVRAGGEPLISCVALSVSCDLICRVHVHHRQPVLRVPSGPTPIPPASTPASTPVSSPGPGVCVPPAAGIYWSDDDSDGVVGIPTGPVGDSSDSPAFLSKRPVRRPPRPRRRQPLSIAPVSSVAIPAALSPAQNIATPPLVAVLGSTPGDDSVVLPPATAIAPPSVADSGASLSSGSSSLSHSETLPHDRQLDSVMAKLHNIKASLSPPKDTVPSALAASSFVSTTPTPPSDIHYSATLDIAALFGASTSHADAAELSSPPFPDLSADELVHRIFGGITSVMTVPGARSSIRKSVLDVDSTSGPTAVVDWSDWSSQSTHHLPVLPPLPLLPAVPVVLPQSVDVMKSGTVTRKRPPVTSDAGVESSGRIPSMGFGSGVDTGHIRV